MNIYISDWLLGISALATLALACITFWAVRKNINYDSEVRAKDRDQESKKRILDEIINWVREIRRIHTSPKEINIFKQGNEKRILQFLELEGDYMIEAAKLFGAEFETKVREIRDDLHTFIELLPNVLDLIPIELAETIRERMGKTIPPSNYQNILCEENATKYKDAYKSLMLSTHNAMSAAISLKKEFKL